MSIPSWTPPPNSGNSNDQQIQNDVNQWLNDKAQMSQDYDAIQDALEQMEKALASGKPDAVFAALMSFFMQIFPDILSFQQDNMNLLADSQNISSDLRGFVNSIQNDFNDGASISTKDPYPDSEAQDLFNNTTDLYQWSQFLSTSQPGLWSGKDSPLDPTDAGQIQQQMQGIASNFGAEIPPSGGIPSGWESNIAGDLTNWFAPPSGTPPADPAPQIKAIQGDLQQANSSVSTMATTTQTSEQFYTNQYNQLTGIDNSMQQNTASEVSSFVTNQKTS